MADVTFTTASILQGANTPDEVGLFGETITAGLFVYRKAADQRFWIADVTASEATAEVIGIALNSGAAGQRVKVQTGGDVTCDNLSLAAAGGVYVLSAAGKMAPHSDLAENDYITCIGVADGATTLRLAIGISGRLATV